MRLFACSLCCNSQEHIWFFLHSLMVVYFIPADSKNNCFEHHKSNCVRSSTWLYCPTTIVSAFLFAYLNVKKQIHSWYLKNHEILVRAAWHIQAEHAPSLFPVFLRLKYLGRVFYSHLIICVFVEEWSGVAIIMLKKKKNMHTKDQLLLGSW